MVYNLTGIVAGNETSLLTFVQGVNTELMGGWLGTMFLIGITIVLFSSFILTTNDVGKSASATGFIVFTLALTLAALHLISQFVLYLTFALVLISVATTFNRT